MRDANLMIIMIMTKEVKALPLWITLNQLYDFILNIDQIFLNFEVLNFLVFRLRFTFPDLQQEILTFIDKNNCW